MHTDPHPDSSLYQLAYSVGDALKARNWFCSTAESCTGGGIASALTAIPGSSEWFFGGWVCYSNMAKEHQLGVQPQTLLNFGAVSEETVKEMAEGARHASHADIAVAVSGIAGPSGGSAEKPVGLVCIAWATATHTETAKFIFDGGRSDVRYQTIITTLNGILKLCCVS
ncbi:CinA family protein [Leeia sp. TBRC 13508]|uniref:CinA family protein n=1 Tax=Leeia speluncae TaxID=2884804 RepID=A0ABS8D8F9_9NEIS|nr:CinA family protein [Leeia speluncae]MCB6184501.1 CinA family protein [Leeia speluncae]